MRKLSYEIILLRCIACIFVAAIHAMGYTAELYSNLSGLYVSFFNSLKVFVNVGTPIFVFIFEFLSAKNYKDGIPRGFLIKKLKNLLPPYIFMGILFSILSILLEGKYLTLSNITLAVYETVLLVDDYFGYFILIIIQFAVMHILLDKILKKLSPSLVISVSFIVNFIYLSIFNFLEPFGFGNQESAARFWYYYSWIPFVGWLFYFILGYYCGRHYEKCLKILKERSTLVFIIPIFITLLMIILKYFGIPENPSSKAVTYLILTPAVIFLVFNLSNRLKSIPKFLISVSDHSFGIYLTHIMTMQIYVHTFSKNAFLLSLNPLLGFALLLIINFLISMLVVNLVNRIPYGKYVVGAIRNNRRSTKQQKNAVSDIPVEIAK